MAKRCSQTRRELAVQPDGTIEVVTTGQGAGPFPAINENLGPYVFQTVDNALNDAARVKEIVYVGTESVLLSTTSSVLRQCQDD